MVGELTEIWFCRRCVVFFSSPTHIIMNAQKLKGAKLLCEEQIKTTHKSRFYHIHLDVMQAFLDAYRRLESYKTDNETEKKLILKRLEILDSRINTFKPSNKTWPQKFENRLLEVVRDARSVDNLHFEVQKLMGAQEDEFTNLFRIYRTLQPTTPA